MDMILSSKMHPAVLGASAFVPILCIAYDHKQTGFFARLDMADCTLEIRSLSYKNLYQKIDHVWNNRNRISTSLEKTIPLWQEDVRDKIKQAMTPHVKTEQDLAQFNLPR
jgi:polysaccharide pyruvyl transferase WcaK-like protein